MRKVKFKMVNYQKQNKTVNVTWPGDDRFKVRCQSGPHLVFYNGLVKAAFAGSVLGSTFN